MKRRWIVLLVLTLLIAFAYSQNSNYKGIIRTLARQDNVGRDHLRYRIYFLGLFPVGEASIRNLGLEEYQSGKVYHLRADAQSLNIFSSFFKGIATLDSYIDFNDHVPLLYTEKLQITGKPDTTKEVFYNHKEMFMSIKGIKRQIVSHTQDPLSAIFNLEHMDLGKVKDLEMNINTNQKNYTLSGTTMRKDLSIDKKVYGLILAKAKIYRRDKNPYHQSQLTVVFLKNKENIPVLIRVFASGTLVVAKLIEAK